MIVFLGFLLGTLGSKLEVLVLILAKKEMFRRVRNAYGIWWIWWKTACAMHDYRIFIEALVRGRVLGLKKTFRILVE